MHCIQGWAFSSDLQSVNNDELRCEDGKMRQNGGHHAIRRRKLPQKSDLPTFFGDLPFLGRYFGYTSVTQFNLINLISINQFNFT